MVVVVLLFAGTPSPPLPFHRLDLHKHKALLALPTPYDGSMRKSADGKQGRTVMALPVFGPRRGEKGSGGRLQDTYGRAHM